MFAKSFVINLTFKTDRLQTFMASLPACFQGVEVWPAVHGDTVQHPDWWKSGRGAWGCYRSHLQILEKCYNEQVDSYIVFEDDAIFDPELVTRLDQFLKHLPADWEQIYLGGQLLHESQNPPRKVNDHVFIPFNVNRTHCFAVHRRGYEKLYKHLNAAPFVEHEHIDHHLGRLHETGSLKLYCPGKWLVGQAAGRSNISGNHNAATFWTHPERLSQEFRTWHSRVIPAVYLDAPFNVAMELDASGWHRGHWKNDQQLDRGVCRAAESATKEGFAEALKSWYAAVLPEAVREGKQCVCVYHPQVPWECVEAVPIDRAWQRIKADTATDARRQLAEWSSHAQSQESTSIVWSPPKPLALPMQHKHVVVTIAIGDEYQKQLEITGPLMQQYARRIGADFITITDRTQTWWGLEKFRLQQIAEAYDRTIYLDADCVVRPTTRNLFDMVAANTVGMHSDAEHDPENANWASSEWEDLIRSQQTDAPYPGTLMNSGVIVCSRAHANIFTPPSLPIPGRHCDEQLWIERNLFHFGHPWMPLPTELNHQWWVNRFEDRALLARTEIIHLAGCKSGRLQLLRDCTTASDV